MFWNKKKNGDKGRLPDLPAEPKAAPSMADYKPSPNLQGLDKLEHEEAEIHALPSFPDSPIKRGFAQSAIKDAIAPTKETFPNIEPTKETFPNIEPTKESYSELPKIPSIKNPKTIEMEEWNPKQPAPSLPTLEKPVRRSIETKPIFVKLEKFQSARDSLETVKEKLDEVDELLRTIREVKIKEDQELSSWEKEIEAIKARISSVASEIFEGPLE